MGLGFHLRARCRAATTLEAIAEWFRTRCEPPADDARVEDDGSPGPILRLGFHPAAEPVEVTRPDERCVVFSARTSGVGPGYHAWLCERLDLWAADSDARFDPEDPAGEFVDETGWFHRRDDRALEQEMQAWFRALASRFVDLLAEPGVGNLKFNMATDSPDFEAIGVLTPMGPRGRDFWRAVAADPAVGERLLPWRDRGIGAGYHLGRALCRMWTDVRWRPPATDDETALDRAVLDDLARARAVDPHRPCPYREWAELLAHLGEEDAEIAACAAAADPSVTLIGYRRRGLRAHPFPGVTIPVPGSFAEQREEDGTWVAWGDGNTAWVSSVRWTGRPAGPPDGDERDPSLDLAAEGTVGWAHWTHLEENGVRFPVLRGRAGSARGDENHEAFVSLVFSDDADRAWAESTWRGIRVTA